MKILQLQGWHFIFLLVMLIGFHFLFYDYSLIKGQLWNLSTLNWLWIAILSPVIHQLYVLICWRSELYHQKISGFFGKEKGFKLFKIGFAILIISRPVSILLLAISNSKSLQLNNYLTYALTLILLVPSIYLFYSLKKYFGINRAFGIDHFESTKFKNEEFVKKGIFKYTSNGMYVFGFFILWIPGILFLSKAAIVVALFNHLYIWVHYYCTELPDIKYIYRKK